MNDKELAEYIADLCYECTGYGDDYYVNSEGDLVCACDECWVRVCDDE